MGLLSILNGRCRDCVYVQVKVAFIGIKETGKEEGINAVE